MINNQRTSTIIRSPFCFLNSRKKKSSGTNLPPADKTSTCRFTNFFPQLCNIVGPKNKGPSSGCAVIRSTFFAFRIACGTSRGSSASRFPNSVYRIRGDKREIRRTAEIIGTLRLAARRVICVAAARIEDFAI